MEDFKTAHGLAFEVAAWPRNDDFIMPWKMYRVGTCEGIWRDAIVAYEILAFVNKKPGNGHLDDVFEWFEQSCKRDGKNLHIREVWNADFKKHLILKRGFTAVGKDDLVKLYTDM